jgi:hypothetical protein
MPVGQHGVIAVATPAEHGHDAVGLGLRHDQTAQLRHLLRGAALRRLREARQQLRAERLVVDQRSADDFGLLDEDLRELLGVLDRVEPAFGLPGDVLERLLQHVRAVADAHRGAGDLVVDHGLNDRG